MEKVGNFEWIVPYASLKKFLEPEFTGLSPNKAAQKALVIGCGTSELSALLVEESLFGQVVSVDNDAGCIEHMKTQLGDKPQLQWLVYDCIEDVGKPQGNCLDDDASFDVVVDKGTFDAILVEGSACVMLADIVRLLRPGGAYVVCSIFSSDLLVQILSIPRLGLDVCAHELKKPSETDRTSATVMVCTKRINTTATTAIMDMTALAAEEKEIMDEFYQLERPLFSAHAKAVLMARFRERSRAYPRELAEGEEDLEQEEPSLKLVDAHRLLFEEGAALDDDDDDDDAKAAASLEFLAYSFELFLEDVAEFGPLAVEGFMTADEAVRFLETMQ